VHYGDNFSELTLNGQTPTLLYDSKRTKHRTAKQQNLSGKWALAHACKQAC